MFPEDVKEYIANEDIAIAREEAHQFNGRAFLFDFEKGDFIYHNGAPMVVEGKEALKVWIEKCIRTIKFRASVHRGVEYGPKIDDLLGSASPTSFVKSEIEREVTEALLRNPYITAVENFYFEVDSTLLNVFLTVRTLYDDDSLEVSIS